MPLPTTPSTASALVLGWGLRIASAIPIPGAIPWPGLNAEPDVIISWGGCCDSEPWPGLYCWDGTTLDFAPPAVARFHITRDAITVRPHPLASHAAVSALLVATAMPALLWLRGLFVLHAAGLALKPDGLAVAIAGPSGSGKSSLALRFIQQGAQLVGDDTLAIDLMKETTCCQGLPGGLIQGPHDMRRFEATSFTHSSHGQAKRLAGIVVLTPGQDLTMRPLRGIEALLAIMRNRHRPRVPSLVGRQQAIMDMASVLCRTTPIWELRFDRQKHALEELGAWISNVSEKDWLADDPIPTD